MKKNAGKVIVLAALVLAAVVALAGCSKKDGSSGGGSTQAASGPITLQFWDAVWGPQTYTPRAKTYVESYGAAHPGVNVVYTSVPWDNLQAVFITAAASGTLPDAATGTGFQQHQYAGQDLILPLDSIIAEWRTEGKLDDFYPGLVEYFTYKGVQVGIPNNIDTRCIFFRRDWFERDGIKIPTNWDEFKAAARHFTKGDVVGFSYAVQGYGGHTCNYFYLNNDGGYFNPDGTANYTNPNNAEALSFIKSLHDERLVPAGAAGYTSEEAVKVYLTGKAAMLIQGGDAITYLEQQADAEVRDGTDIMYPMKGPSATEAVCYVCLNAVMGFNTTKSSDETLKFLKWYSENNLVLWTEGGQGPYPTKRSFMADAFYADNRLKNQMGERVLPYIRNMAYPLKGAVLPLALIDGESWGREDIQAAISGRDINAQLASQQRRLQEALEDSQ
jgi:multiple sugar transport system substrate-binding protein